RQRSADRPVRKSVMVGRRARFHAGVKPVDLEVRNALSRDAGVEIAAMAVAVGHAEISLPPRDLRARDALGTLAQFLNEVRKTAVIIAASARRYGDRNHCDLPRPYPDPPAGIQFH